MTNGEKATALLSYLDGLDTTSVINVLHPFIEDDVLAAEYDKFVNDGLIEDPKQTAKLILLVSQEDYCWGALAERYQESYSIESVLELARKRYPEVLRDDEVDEMDGEIQDEIENVPVINGENEMDYVTHTLTWEDGMGEVMRIYEK